MVKKKEKLQHINIRHQKFQNKIKKGFKISSRRSQIFDSTPVKVFKTESEDVKEISSIREGSSPKSSFNLQTHFLSPERRGQYEAELQALNVLDNDKHPQSCFADKTKSHTKFKKVEFANDFQSPTWDDPHRSSPNLQRDSNEINMEGMIDIKDEEYFKDMDSDKQRDSLVFKKVNSESKFLFYLIL
jgi:hypothetical protein